MIATECDVESTEATSGQQQPKAAVDILRLPFLGRFLRWPGSRTTLQIPVFLLGMIMIGHALWGPQLAPKNLGTLLTWVHFRGLVVLVILLAGNLFCMACPFMLPRELARRIHSPNWRWPRWLRNKWPAIGLFVLVLFAYELFDLWSHPWWTGMLIVGYFAAALVVDALFQRASFCKYVCPIGQFNFLSSTLSPLEVAVREANTCEQCRTKDCLLGVRAAPNSQLPSGESNPLPIIQRGCELGLFLPRKIGNLDCTFCLDCVYACPHDNIGLVARTPGGELQISGTRAGIGRIENRVDFTALTVVFTFGALLNAFAMISPVYALETWIAGLTGLRVEWPILAAMFTIMLVLEPAILLGGAAWLTQIATKTRQSVFDIVNRFARSLLPIGFGIWLAHYGFHFFTGCLTVIPIAQNAALQSCGWPLLGEPLWQLGGLPESVVFPMEVGFMGLGLLGSWMVAWSISLDVAPRKAANGFAPWALLHLLLFAAALWIMTQPMDMRGTFLGG